MRFKIFCMLARLGHPHADEAIKDCLSSPLLYNAPITLFEQAGEEVIEIIRNIMHGQDPAIRIQAALILARTGKGAEANTILQEAYKSTERDVQVLILKALGCSGDENTIPFLASLLAEPHQNLKIMAASALIQCLYH